MMDLYTATEESYKNGYKEGFTEGEYECIRKILMYLEPRMKDSAGRCRCGRTTMSRFYSHCPYCGTKYEL